MDREIKILHTADTHLGYKQYHNEVRRKDFFEAFEIVINDAVEMQVDSVVHAGDLFDSRNPTLEDLLETINILSRLKAADIPFFGIVGNHESKQNTQWLDLLQEMGLAARLGKKPQLVGDVAVYGIDSVPRSKIPLFDYSGFETPYASQSGSFITLLVMHQIVQPFPYAEWDCAEMIEKFPFKVDAVLLGDYHKYEKFKVGETWVTYPGSTERNSNSEEGPRSYNIITLSDEGVEISKRTIPTRYFLSIPVTLNEEEKPYEQIFSAINEHLEELPESVVFLEISGDSGAVLSFSEIEDYLLKKGALVSNVKDRRIKESFPEEALKITFSDPDHAVANEIKQMNLNDGGLIIDEIVRSPTVPKSRVDEETEERLSRLIDVIDFKDPDFRIKIPFSPARFTEPQEARTDDDVMLDRDIGQAVKNEFIGKTELAGGVMTGNHETFRASERIRNSDIENPEFSAVSLKSPDSVLEPALLSEPASEPAARNPAFPKEISKVPEKSSEKKIESQKQGKSEPKKEEVGKTEELAQGTPAKASDITGKTPKKGQRKGKGKTAVPRQYNLGDYI